MPKLIDCFLYNDEIELLELRLQLLEDVVDRFVIVASKETFTGIKKHEVFPEDNEVVLASSDRIDLVVLNRLEGKSAWEKESYSRNAISIKLQDLSSHDLIMVSDIDEIPNPDVLNNIKENSELGKIIVLEQEYFNFKFNFKMFHGLQTIWAGPVITSHRFFESPQAMRDRRWELMKDRDNSIPKAGWHFSFLTGTGNISNKLSSFSHQEVEIQQRTSEVSRLLDNRAGFHDHIHPGSVWGFVDISTLACRKLEQLIYSYPSLYEADTIDDAEIIGDKTKRSISTALYEERSKVLGMYSTWEITKELKHRLLKRIV